MFTLIYIRFFLYISILLFALLYFKFSAGGTMYVKFSLFYVLFIYLLLANVFLFIEIYRKHQEESSTNPICCLTLYFGMNRVISHLCFFTSMHMLNFVFWISVIHLVIKLEWSHGSRLLSYELLKEGSRGNFGSILDFPGIPN